MNQNKKLHILVIPSWYPENKDDFRGSFFREQSLGVYKQGCNVGVIFPHLKSLRGFNKIRILPKIEFEYDEGIKTFRMLWNNWFPKITFLQIFFFKILGLILFKRYAKKFGKPDLIHCHSVVMAGWLAEKISDKHNIPFVITEHNSLFFEGYHKQLYSKVSEICNKASMCFAVSSDYSKKLVKIIPNSPNWISHNNIVKSDFLTTKIDKKNKEPFVFLSIANLAKHKNVPLILKSFKKFNLEHPKSLLKIVGVGPEASSLNRLKDRLQIKNVSFLGTKTRKEIVEEFNRSNVFILGTTYETFGVVLVESIAMGVPVIVTDCGGSDDIMNRQVGRVTKQNDVEDMYNSMIEIYKKYNGFKPERLREQAKSNFSESILSKKLINYYYKVLS
jgi:glycosyltransferase involved in cell wall biosynthesis